MKTLFFIAILFCPFLLSAQKLLKPQIDATSGDTTWSTSEEKLYLQGNYLTAQGYGVTCQIIKLGNSNNIMLVLNPQSLNIGTPLSILKGQKAYLKFTDGSFIILNASFGDAGTSLQGIAGDKEATTNYYNVPAAAIKKLASSPIVFLSIGTTSGNFDCDIKLKNAKKLMKEVLLIETI